MTAPSPLSGVSHDPGPDHERFERKARRPRPRASVISQAAVFATLAIALVSLDRTADSVELRRYLVDGWIALLVGAAVGSLTPIKRPLRYVSAWPVAIGVAGFVSYLAWNAGSADRETGHLVFVILMVILGLDLAWVSRLRSWVFLSALFVIPVLVVTGPSQQRWALGWLTAAFVTLWLLANDTNRAVDRPETLSGEDPGRRRRPRDLLVIGLVGLLTGSVMAVVLSSPSYSFRPLEKLVRYLPFRPELDLSIDTDLDIRAYELDDLGMEVRYRIDPEGRRFVLDPDTNLPYAVVRSGGDDEVRGLDGTVIARIGNGASFLSVVRPDGSTTSYLRDERGWYLEANGARYTVVVEQGVRLQAPTGELSAPGGEVDVAGSGPFGALAEKYGPKITLPSGAVLDGTTGRGTVREQWGEEVLYRGRGQGRRYYWKRWDGELRVKVDHRSGRYRYDWSEDRSEVRITVEKYDQSAVVEMDREGNVFDDLDRWAKYLEDRQSSSADAAGDSGAPWEGWGRWLWPGVALALVAAAVAVGWRWVRARRRTDLDWASLQLARLESFGAKHGRTRAPADTVVGFLAGLADLHPEHADPLRHIADVLDDAFYGRQAITPEDRREVEALIALVRGDKPIGGDEEQPEENDGSRRPPRRPREPVRA